MNLELKEENGNINLYVPSNKNLKDIYNLITKLQKSEINVIKVDRLSLDQSKLIWVLCGEYGELLGYEREEMRYILENEFCSSREIEYFSISPFKKNACSIEIATEFITFIIEHSIREGYNLIIPEGKGEKRTYKHSRDICPDIRRYILACMLNKVCCVCGKRIDIDLHHSPALGVSKDQDDGKKTGFMTLCREHHTLAHGMGLKEFEKLFHLQPVWLSDNLIKELKKIYYWHFQAFHGGKNNE